MTHGGSRGVPCGSRALPREGDGSVPEVHTGPTGDLGGAGAPGGRQAGPGRSSGRWLACAFSCIALAAGPGCEGADPEDDGPAPAFTLAWSAYPSWSVFPAAQTLGLIDGAEGRTGPVEDKWKVDIVLVETGYDAGIARYVAGECDAVCVTNLDALRVSLSKRTVAFLPTSTSDGADALLTVGIDDLAQLRGRKVRGPVASVSAYSFHRGLELAGEKASDHELVDMDAAAASRALISGQDGCDAVLVRSPLIVETLRQRPDAKVLLDSSTLQGEIIDLVVTSHDVLEAKGGDRFAEALTDVFYQVCARLGDPETADGTLVAIGEKTGGLGIEQMRDAVKRTRFYKSPAAGMTLLGGETLQSTMYTLTEYALARGILDRAPKLNYSSRAPKDAQLVFDLGVIKAATVRR